MVHLVTLLEQLPVQETLDAAADLAADGLHLGALVVNQARDGDAREAVEVVAATEPDPARIGAQLESVGIRTSPAMIDGLLLTAADAVERRDLELSLEDDVVAAGRPVLRLPHLPDGVGPDAVRRLAAELAAQGVGS